MFANPYKNVNSQNTIWLKSNFHTHAGTGKNTCGALEIDEVLSSYKGAGYDVITISNHDLFTDCSKYEEIYELTIINGYEHSQGTHMLCINVEDLIKGTHQEVIEECNRQGGFIILCHPNWKHKEYWPFSELDKLKGYTGIEIYNGVVFQLPGSGLATDTWDYLLSQGKLVWGFGNDDFHRWQHLNRVCNMIAVPSATQKDIVSSICDGSFYVSTGLVLNQFDFSNDVITLSASAIQSYVKENTYIFSGKNGKVLHEHYGESASYRVKPDDMYVRVTVRSEHGAMLWTQPVYDESLFARP